MQSPAATDSDNRGASAPIVRVAAREWRGRIQTAAFPLALAALFLFGVLFRFLLLSDGFSNDHFLHLASAQQMLFGDWPTRDFLDPGLPLMYVTSALVQLLLGRTLFAEAMLVSFAFGLAAILTAVAVRGLTGSRILALLAAGLEIAVVPRAYSYPKLLLYAAAFVLLQRYVTRSSVNRLVALAVAAVVAFFFRHDHGVHLGIAGVLASVLAPNDRRNRWQAASLFLGIVALLTAPYFLYVQIHGGVISYIRKGLEFRAAELTRQPSEWPSLSGEQPYQAALLYAYWAIPIIAAMVLVVYRRRADARTIMAAIVPLVVVAFLVNTAFLRTSLAVRLPDAVVPALVIGSWLIACAWRSRRVWMWGPLSVLSLALVASSVVGVGNTVSELERAGLLAPWKQWPRLVDETAASLRAKYSEQQMPSRAAATLMPFYPYVARCTTTDHRLLVVGFLPEAHFFSQRAFAGGLPVFVDGYYYGEAYQRAVLRTLSRQVVPFVLVPGQAYAGDFSSGFPLVAEYVRERYVSLVRLGSDPATGVEIMIDRMLPAGALDTATGWPCWK